MIIAYFTLPPILIPESRLIVLQGCECADVEDRMFIKNNRKCWGVSALFILQQLPLLIIIK